MLDALGSERCTVHVISTARNPFPEARLNIRWHQVGKRLKGPLKTIWYFLFSPLWSTFFCLVQKVDCVVAFGPVYALVFLPGALSGRTKIYTMVRGMLSDEYTLQGRGGAMRRGTFLAEKIGLRVSKRVIVVSQVFGEKVQKRYGISAERIAHLPNEIPHVSDADIDARFGDSVWRNAASDEAIRLFFAGVITPRKNYEMLFETAAFLRIPFHICIAGRPACAKDASYLDELRDIIEKRNIERHVSWLGWLERKKVLGVLKKADLFVSTSHHEGMSNAILEGLALHIPCVAKATPEALELLGASSLTFKTAEELATLIERYYDEDMFKRKIQEAAKQARTKWLFNWEEKLLEVLGG